MFSSDPTIAVTVNYRNALEGHVERCVQSLIEQTYENWTAYLCDDASDTEPDFPYDRRIRYRRNKLRLGSVANTLYTLAYAADADIVVQLDGDDMLRNHALSVIVEHHMAGADLTWGSSETWGFDAGIVYRAEPFKGDLWDFSAMAPRSYRMSLYRQAWEKWGWSAFADETGEPWPFVTDIAILYPLIRIARKPTPITDVIYYTDRSGMNHDPAREDIRQAIIRKSEKLQP